MNIISVLVAERFISLSAAMAALCDHAQSAASWRLALLGYSGIEGEHPTSPHPYASIWAWPGQIHAET